MTFSNTSTFPAYFIRRTSTFGRKLPNGIFPEIIEIEMVPLAPFVAGTPAQALSLAKQRYSSFSNSLCIGAPHDYKAPC